MATCSFLIISINLINGLSTKIGNPQFLIMKVFGRMVNHQYMSRPQQTAYFTSLKLPIQNLPWPTWPSLVTSFLGFLVGKSFTGLMSFFLVTNIAATVFIQSLFCLDDLQGCNGCLNNVVENSFGTLLLLNLTCALGILAEIFHTTVGCCGFFRLVAAFLKILALPLMEIFAGIALMQGVINLVVYSFDFGQNFFSH